MFLPFIHIKKIQDKIVEYMYEILTNISLDGKRDTKILWKNIFMEDLLEKVRRNTEEIITQEELKNLIEAKKSFNFYYGTASTWP